MRLFFEYFIYLLIHIALPASIPVKGQCGPQNDIGIDPSQQDHYQGSLRQPEISF